MWEITCKRCGNTWKLQPSRWSNHSLVKKGKEKYKIIHCPACQCPNYISVPELLKILKKKK